MLTASSVVPHKHLVQEASDGSPMTDDFPISTSQGLPSCGLEKVCVAMGVTT